MALPPVGAGTAPEMSGAPVISDTPVDINQLMGGTDVPEPLPPEPKPALPPTKSFVQDAPVDINQMMGGPPTVETTRTPEMPTIPAYSDSRAVAEKAPEQMPVVRGFPVVDYTRKEALSLLQPKITNNADLIGIKDKHLTELANFITLAESEGYRVQFTSGYRSNSKTYHGHGEAVDLWLQKKDPKTGKYVDFKTGKEQAETVAKLAARVGNSGSVLNEVDYDPSGASSGPHIHWALGGKEHNLLKHPSHYDVSGYKERPHHAGNEVKDPKAKDRESIPSMVEAMAKAYDIDPDLAVRWVEAESSFNPAAKSPAGARGLTQMMPGTIREVAEQLGVDPAEYDKSPKLQVRMGLHYLKKQLEANDGNYARAFAAYNAGPGGLKNQIAQGKMYAETASYVGKIMGGVDPDVADAASAEQAVLLGKGRKYEPNVARKRAEDDIRKVQPLFEQMLGDWFSWDNPTSLPRTGFSLANDVLYEVSSRFVPNSKLSLETKEARDEIAGDNWYTEKFLQSPAFTARMIGATLLGVGLTKMFKAVGVGDALGSVGKWIMGHAPKPFATAAAGFADTGLMRGLASAVNKPALGLAASAGAMQTVTANLLEMGMSGYVQGVSMVVGDWLNNGPEGSTLEDIIPEALASGKMLGFASMGLGFASMGLGGFVLPMAGALARTSIGSLLGKEISDDLAGYYSKMGTSGRTAFRAGAGVGLGTMAGATTDMLGITEEGHGTNEGPWIGATAAVIGGPIAAKMLARANQSPAFRQSVEQFRKFMNSATPDQRKGIARELMDMHEENTQINERVITEADAVSGIRVADNYLKEAQQLVNTKMQDVTVLEQKKNALVTQRQAMVNSHQQVEQQLPNGAAWLTQEASLTAQAKTYRDQLQAAVKAKQPVSPALQQSVQQADQALAQHKEMLLKDKDLNKEVNKLKTYRANHENQLGELDKQLKLVETSAIQSRITQEAMQDGIRTLESTKQALSTALKAAQNPDEVFKNPLLQANVAPWAKVGPIREFVDTDALAAAQKQQISEFAHSLMQRTVKQEDPVARQLVDKLVTQVAREKAVNEMGAGFAEAVGANLTSAKQQLKKLQDRNLGKIDALTKEKLKDLNENSLISWEAPKVKGQHVFVLNAETVQRGLMHPDYQLNQQTVEQRAVALRQAWKTGKAQPPVFDPANPDYAELAAHARAALDHGDSRVPISFVGQGRKNYTEARKALTKKLTQDRQKVEVGELEDLIAKVETLTKESAHSPTYKDLVTYDQQNQAARSIEPGEVDDFTMAQGGSPGKVSDDLHLVQNLRRRLDELAERVEHTEGPNFASIYKQTVDELAAGSPVSHPAYKQFLKSKSTDWTKAPPEVQKLRQYITEDMINEMNRIRSLDMMQMGRGESPHVRVASAVREARAAGLDLSQAGPDIKVMQEAGERLLQADRSVHRSFGQWLADNFKETATQDQVYSEIFGAIKRGWEQQIESRRRAVTRFIQNTVIPTFQTRMEKFLSVHNDTLGKMTNGQPSPIAILDEVQVKAFQAEFAGAVEDSVQMKKFLEKYGDNAKPLAEVHYAIQELIDQFRASSPELDDFARANYFSHRFRRMSDSIAVARQEGALSLSAEDASSHLRTFATFEDLKRAQADTRKHLQAKNIDEDQFLRSFDADRAKLYHYGKSPAADEAWNKLQPKERMEKITAANKQAVVLMADDPILDPMVLYQMQLGSIWQADASRQFLKSMNDITYYDSKKKVIRRALDISTEPGSVIPTATDHKGKDRPYTRLSEIKGFAGIKGIQLKANGEKYAADQLMVHPEAAHFLRNFVENYEPPSTLGKMWNYAIHGSRSMTLMGTWIPHLSSMINGPMAEFWLKPRQASYLMATGKALLERADGEAAMIEAIRYGVNPVLMERTIMQIGNAAVQDLGKELAEQVTGLGGKLDQTFAAADRSNPMYQMAKEKLKGTWAGRLAEVMGVPISTDWTINRHMLFKQIEYGALAGFHLRASEFLRNHGPELMGLAPEARLNAAYQYAAYKTNVMMGSLTDGAVNNWVKGILRRGGLTPSWYLSQAQVIVDGIDSLLYLGQKKLTGGRAKRSLAEVMTGRRYTSQFPQEVRDIVRSRMMNTVIGGLVGSLGMVSLAQYLWNGTTSMQYSPDKLFHLNDGENNWSGFMIGIVRPLLNFGGKLLTDPQGGFSIPGKPKSVSTFSTEVDAGDLWSRATEAITQVVERQMAPPVEAILSSLAQAPQEFHGGPMALADLAASAALKSTAIPEMMGMDQNTVNFKHVLAKLVPFMPEDLRKDAMARTKSPQEMLMSFLGHYKSRDKGLAWKMKGMMADRQRAMNAKARAEFLPLIKKAAEAERAQDYDKASEYHELITKKRAKGVYIDDPKFRAAYGRDYYRISSEALRSLLMEELDPDRAAMSRSNGAVARAVGEVLWDVNEDRQDQDEMDYLSGGPSIGE